MNKEIKRFEKVAILLYVFVIGFLCGISLCMTLLISVIEERNDRLYSELKQLEYNYEKAIKEAKDEIFNDFDGS